MKLKKALAVTGVVLGTTFVVMRHIVKKQYPKSVYADQPEEQNPMKGKKVVFVENENDPVNADGKQGHLEAIGVSEHIPTFYEKYIKRGLDVVLSFGGMVVLAPVYAVTAIAIKVDDPGPVLFRQKRVGTNKSYFELFKFRSMSVNTPKDVPTHMLKNGGITKIGAFIRKSSIDELPQLWNIFCGNMSVIGSRPALWNQDYLTAERDKYGANDVKPGLTGLAQISGRDELEIERKARLDGVYADALKKSSWSGFIMDCKMFFGSISVTLHRKGIVEGGTGAIAKEKAKADVIGDNKKRVLFLANHFITLYAFRKELIQRLVEEGHEVYLSLPEDAENKYFEKLGCHIVITEIDRRGVNPANDLKLIAFYRKMIKQVNPDIIFSYTIKPNIYGTLVTNGKYKQVCNITGTGATFLEDNKVAKICKLLYKISVKKCYKVFFQNTGDRDFFIENGMIGDNYEMLPGSGCNLAEHPYTEMPDDGVIRFLFIGRVMKLKGIDEYLKAAETVKSKYPNTEFIIAGWNEEEEYQKIVAKYQEKGYVKYIGFRDDINDWIAKCNCTVLPSHGGEGVPNVLLESAAMGRICIGSNIPGTANVIDDGKTGFLFEIGDVGGLVTAIEKVITMDSDSRSSMGLAGHEKVKAEFDREIVVNRYIDEVEKA